MLVIILFGVKNNNAQSLQWVRQIGSAAADFANDVVIDAAGNVYVVGEFYNTVDFDPGVGVVNLTSAGNADVFIIKYTSAGNLVWARKMGGAEGDGGYAIALDGSNNVYIQGTFRSTADFDPGATAFNLTSAGLADVFVCKLTNAGIFTWAKRFGGTANEYSTDIEIDNAGSVITTGRFGGTVDFDPGVGVANLAGGPVDAFISKLSSAGNYVWVKHITCTSSVFIESMTEDAAGNLYFTGSFHETADFDPGATTANLTVTACSSTNAFVLKLNATGIFQWVKRFGGTNSTWAYGIKVGNTGTIYTTGFFEGTADFDPGTGTVNLVSAGNRDVFLSRLNSSGNFLSATRIGSTGEDGGGVITVDPAGNIYISGRYSATTDFNPGAGTANRTATGVYDCFILKLSSTLTFTWVCTFGGTGGDDGRGIALDAANNVVITGLFTGTSDFDPGSGTVNLTAQSIDGFILKLNNPSPLPIELLSFNATPNKKTIDLTWATATELNNDFFTIEKSKDGNEFEDVAKVDGAGNSNQVIEYSFTDKNPYNGLSYYRLKQTDFNGDFSYSKTVAVNLNPNNQFYLYQNPSANHIIVAFKNAETQPCKLLIHDVTGRMVHEQQITSATTILNFAFLPGVYVASVTYSQQAFSQKFIVR
ncbi:MAG: SBBP repeat-containing protein [Bacteroidetes bacterium]|nr:SBBP repeat-containing protein [Bacteroidota bacterium]